MTVCTYKVKNRLQVRQRGFFLSSNLYNCLIGYLEAKLEKLKSGIPPLFYSFEWKNGTCNKYNGTICLPYLGNTTLNQDIFFDARYGVNGTESILQKFIQISDISVRESQLCR